MNPKLENIKTALRLVIEQSEKANNGIYVASGFIVVAHTDTSSEGIAQTYNKFNSEYIATACNMGAPMAKALLIAIDIKEKEINGAQKSWETYELKKDMAEMLNCFPDPETTNTEAK